MFVIFDLACIAFFWTLVLTPYVRKFSKRLQWVDLPDQKRKLHGQPIPRLGGVAIALSYVFTLAFILVAPYKTTLFDLNQALNGAYALAPAAVIVLLIGLLDDIRGLKPWQKLTGQTIAAGWAYAAGFGVYGFRGSSLEIWFSLPLTIIWLVGCTNALNLIDGMDGLAAGVGFFAALTTLVAALIHGNIQLAMVTATLAGALLGFLRYNFNPASIFLGDSGSLLIGFLLGCYGALWSQKAATILGMTAPLMALAIPLLDATLSIVRRFLRNRPIFVADRGHIHHRLLDLGLTPRGAVLLLYAVCGAAAALSLLQEMIYNQFGGLIIVLFCVAAWIGVQHLGYGELGLAGRLVLGGALRGIIDSQLRLQQFEKSLRAADQLHEAWEIIWAGCQDFGFSGARLKVCDIVLERHTRSESTALVPSWQLRIPLPDSQYVNLYRSLDTPTHAIVMPTFGRIVWEALVTKLPSFESTINSESGTPGEQISKLKNMTSQIKETPTVVGGRSEDR